MIKEGESIEINDLSIFGDQIGFIMIKVRIIYIEIETMGKKKQCHKKKC